MPGPRYSTRLASALMIAAALSWPSFRGLIVISDDHVWCLLLLRIPIDCVVPSLRPGLGAVFVMIPSTLRPDFGFIAIAELQGPAFA